MDINYDKYIKIITATMQLKSKILKDKACELGLSEGEAGALMFFYKHAGMDNAADMVKECKVSKAFVSKIMISLLAKKLIVIETDKTDKRARNITLTQEAKQKSQILDDVLLDYLNNVFAGLSQSQIQEIDTIFDVVEKNTQTISRKELQV